MKGVVVAGVPSTPLSSKFTNKKKKEEDDDDDDDDEEED